MSGMSRIIIECHLDESDVSEFDWEALRAELKTMIESDTWLYVDDIKVEP